jgi:hypothetical protein
MIMKKNFLFYLLMMALPITFFSACGDDKKDDGGGGSGGGTTPTPTATTWKDGVGAYKTGDGSTLLKIDGEAPTETTKSVALATGSGDKAKITLTNLVPDAAAVEFDNVEMTKSGDNYTFSTETTVGTTTITISGTLSGIPATKADAVTKTLDVKIERKINSPIAGTWKLNFVERMGSRFGDVNFEVSTGDPATDMGFTQGFGPALGSMLAQKVTEVKAVFGENGTFDVTWVNQGETESTGMPEAVKRMVKIMYFASEDQIFLALDKALVPMLEAMVPENLDITELLASMIKDDYLIVPLDFAEFTGRVPVLDVIPTGYTYYMKKEMVLAVLPIIMPMLGNLDGMPPQIGPMLQSLPEIVANSELFNVGLNFVPEDGLLSK